MSILEIKDLTKQFVGLVAVSDLSFEMPERPVHILIEPNDSRETTAINMIDGVFPLTERQILFRGTEITGKSTHEISRLGPGRTLQNIKLFSALTVEENLMVGGHMAYAKADITSFSSDIRRVSRKEEALKEATEGILESMKLKDIAKRQVGGLPYNMLEVVELARIVMARPKPILSDEPATGLSPSERCDLIEILIRVFDDDIDLFLVEHNMDTIMNINHKITVVNFGSEIAEGKPVDI